MAEGTDSLLVVMNYTHHCPSILSEYGIKTFERTMRTRPIAVFKTGEVMAGFIFQTEHITLNFTKFGEDFNHFVIIHVRSKAKDAHIYMIAVRRVAIEINFMKINTTGEVFFCFFFHFKFNEKFTADLFSFAIAFLTSVTVAVHGNFTVIVFALRSAILPHGLAAHTNSSCFLSR